jgi:hypothetical protein
MEDSAFSDEFCRFIQTWLPSVDAAELLLLLARERDKWWDAPALAAALRPSTTIADADAARYLEQFQAAGLVAAGPDKRVQFRPGSEELRAQVDMLAQAYKERPVTLIRMIYALRDSKIQSFADAFKLRRK